MTADVSNTTVAILLALTLLVSIVGTWTVIDVTNHVTSSSATKKGMPNGQIVFAGEDIPVSEKPGRTAYDARVSVTIVK